MTTTCLSNSFLKPAAPCLPATLERALVSGTSHGQPSAEGHGWIRLSCEKSVVRYSSTKNWGKKNPYITSCHLESRLTPARTCVPYGHSCGVQRRHCQPICPTCSLPAAQPWWAAEAKKVSYREVWFPFPPPWVWMASPQCGCGVADPASIGVYLTCAREDEHLQTGRWRGQHPHGYWVPVAEQGP